MIIPPRMPFGVMAGSPRARNVLIGFVSGLLALTGTLSLIVALKDRWIRRAGVEVVGAVEKTEVRRLGRRGGSFSWVAVSYPVKEGQVQARLHAWHAYRATLAEGAPVKVRYLKNSPRHAVLPDGLVWVQVCEPLLRIALGFLGFLYLFMSGWEPKSPLKPPPLWLDKT